MSTSRTTLLGGACLATLLAGCSHDPTQLYAHASTNAEPSPVAYIKYDDSKDCAACFASRCVEQAAKCEADEACRVYDGCVRARACQAPDCFFSCYAEQQAHEENPGALPSPLVWSLAQCGAMHCGKHCSYSDDPWACSGQYSWRDTLLDLAGEPLTFRVVHRSPITDAPQPDVPVRVCNDLDRDCGQPVGEETRTDNAGQASLTIPSVLSALGAPFHVESGSPEAGVLPVLIYPPRGLFVPRMYYIAGTPTRDEAGEVQVPPGSGNLVFPSQDLGAIIVRASGCDGLPAADLTLEVQGAGEQARVTYGLSSSDATKTDSTGYVFATGVAPGKRTVAVRRADDQTLLAHRRIEVRASSVTYFLVSPPDEVEQAALDEVDP